VRAVKVIRDPEAFQLLGDDTRRRIIHLLRAKEMTVAQIASELSLTPQAIYHHIRKMKDTGLIEIAKEERVGHFIETYYRSTAEVFHLAHGEGEKDAECSEAQIKDALQAMEKLGIKMRCEPATAAKVRDITKKMKDPWHSDWTEKIEELSDVDFFTKQSLVEFANLVSISDGDFEDYLKGYRELRKTLKSCVESEKPKKKG